MTTRYTIHTNSYEERIASLRTVATELKNSKKNKAKSDKEIRQLSSQIRDSNEKLELLNFFLKSQIPINIAILGIALLSGGLQVGLPMWGATSLVQAIGATVTYSKKQKEEYNLAELETDKAVAEYNSNQCNQAIKQHQAAQQYLCDPKYEQHEEEYKREREADEVFQIINGEPIKVEKPIQYVKK